MIFSGADNFQSKDYQTSAELFEKSMLYIAHDTENRILRAKGYRVLCLCHLGLLQLDRAKEYIDEAEKVLLKIRLLNLLHYSNKKNHSSFSISAA